MSEQKYEETQLYRIRHSAAHVMAQAVLEFYPEAKYTIGPPVENGFYYDFEFSHPSPPRIWRRSKSACVRSSPGSHKFEKKVVSADEARQVFASQPYKLELIDGLEKGGLDEYGNPLNEKPEISLYQHDKFVDLCRGPHVESTKQINPSAFKLMSIAGAYWRGDEKNTMLHAHLRHSLGKPAELEHYLWQLEEAKKRDHRKLGKELGLFYFSEDVGPGLPLFTPKGEMLRYVMENLRPRCADAPRLPARVDRSPRQGRPVHALGAL